MESPSAGVFFGGTTQTLSVATDAAAVLVMGREDEKCVLWKQLSLNLGKHGEHPALRRMKRWRRRRSRGRICLSLD